MKGGTVIGTAIGGIIVGWIFSLVLFALGGLLQSQRSAAASLMGGLVLIVPAGGLFWLSRLVRADQPEVAMGLKIAAIFVFILAAPCGGLLMISGFLR